MREDCGARFPGFDKYGTITRTAKNKNKNNKQVTEAHSEPSD